MSRTTKTLFVSHDAESRQRFIAISTRWIFLRSGNRMRDLDRPRFDECRRASEYFGLCRRALGGIPIAISMQAAAQCRPQSAIRTAAPPLGAADLMPPRTLKEKGFFRSVPRGQKSACVLVFIIPV